MASQLTIGIAAGFAGLALAGCGSTAARPTPPAPGAVAASTRPVTVPTPQDGIEAPGTGERLFANVGSDGAGNVVTRIAVSGRDGRNHVIRVVPGSWSLPAAVPGQWEGISWDGSRVVLVSTDDPGRFLAVSTRDPHAAPRVVAPNGRFVYDGMSVDGEQLFLTQTADAGGGPAYRIRRYDLATGRLDPEPIVDKLEGDEAMVGDPVARASATDFLYTVYERQPRPFVHALDSHGAYSLCIDLPDDGNPAAPAAWSARRLGPSVVAISNAVLRTAYRLAGGELTEVAYADVVE